MFEDGLTSDPNRYIFNCLDEPTPQTKTKIDAFKQKNIGVDLLEKVG